MKRLRFVLRFVLSLFLCIHLFASASYSKTYHIMLQGFHYNSCKVPGCWYNIINQNAQRIKDSGFTLVWFPPPSKAVNPLGYEPTELNNLNSGYGTEQDLKNAINALSPEVKVLADIVINHRSGTEDACTFTNPEWPQHTICQCDEYCDASKKSINSDTGDPVRFSRDLDHINPTTQNCIKEWMQMLKKAGFAGWRYDMVKGYYPKAIEIYNDATNPEFTVGEYFDYDTEKVVDWIDGTHSDPSKRATAFDFPLRNALYQAVAWKNYDHLKYHDRTSGVIGLWADKAVTFLENHDTEEARDGEHAPYFPGPGQGILGDQMIQGYAVILTHPGTPCIFWRDIYDSGPDLENKMRELIKIRKLYGINSESGMYIDKAQKDFAYAAYVTGDKGEIAVKIGPGDWNPVGDKWDPVKDLLTSGKDYAIWGEHGWQCP